MIPYPIGDMLTRIRNANRRYHPDVVMPHSKMKESIARILEQEGYIEGFEVSSRSLSRGCAFGSSTRESGPRRSA